MTRTQIILRLFLSFIFLVSAVTKLISIDDFEVYIYSLNILSLNNSFLFARCVISLELLLGLCYLFNIQPKITKPVGITLTLFFSIFLLLQVFNKNEENCYCFGKALELTPIESLLKNLPILIALYFLHSKNAFNKYSFVQAGVAIAIPTIIFITSPPDFIFKDQYTQDIEMDVNYLNQHVLSNNTLTLPIPEKGYYLLNLYSNTCKHCKKSQDKIALIFANNNISTQNTGIIFWGDSTKTETFFKDHPPRLNHNYLGTKEFLRLTRGKMPITILLLDGKIVNLYNSRSIDESEIVTAFKQ